MKHEAHVHNITMLIQDCVSAPKVLKRINREIAQLIKKGENLPPPPKTAIAGPEYFGLVQTDIVEAIENLDPEHACDLYWWVSVFLLRLAVIPSWEKKSACGMLHG